MPATPNELFVLFDALGIAHHTVTHEPVFTVAEAQALRCGIPGGHTKNLLLKDRKDRLFLVVAEEDARIDLKTIHEKIGASGKVSFASADLLRAHWGVEPGSVTPFGAINDKEGLITVVLDADLLRHERLNFHPLVNSMTTGIAREDLIGFLKATHHEALVVTATEAREKGSA
jgi:Ala-tRNA(Pro) deacylase